MPYYALLFIGKPSKTPAKVSTNSVWEKRLVQLKNNNIYHSGSAFPLEGTSLTGDKTSDFSPNNSTVGGYVIIKANSLENTSHVAQGSPHAQWGGITEIRLCRDLV